MFAIQQLKVEYEEKYIEAIEKSVRDLYPVIMAHYKDIQFDSNGTQTEAYFIQRLIFGVFARVPHTFKFRLGEAMQVRGIFDILNNIDSVNMKKKYEGNVLVCKTDMGLLFCNEEHLHDANGPNGYRPDVTEKVQQAGDQILNSTDPRAPKKGKLGVQPESRLSTAPINTATSDSNALNAEIMARFDGKVVKEVVRHIVNDILKKSPFFELFNRQYCQLLSMPCDVQLEPELEKFVPDVEIEHNGNGVINKVTNLAIKCFCGNVSRGNKYRLFATTTTFAALDKAIQDDNGASLLGSIQSHNFKRHLKQHEKKGEIF